MDYVEKNDKKRNVSRMVLWIILGVTCALLLAVLGTWLYRTLVRPEVLFKSSVVQQYALSGAATAAPNEIAAEKGSTATPEPDIMDGHIVNLLLLGIDQDYKNYAEDGGDNHTDAMVVIAINFDEATVDLISLPRDTFSRIPGYRGFYKLNAAINCGGGKTEKGFRTCCDAASWMLGGISVDYYFALDMKAVIVIGDAIDGVDFDVDMGYTGSSGNKYRRGMQHLDGTGIYDYMRARTNATKNATDDGRMDRQKRMLVAMFDKVKNERMLSAVPGILNTVADLSYTNLSSQQLIALANFAGKLDTETIGMCTMSGPRGGVLDYVYTFTDQDKRLSIIREVYGVDVEPITNCSLVVARWISQNGLYALRCMQISEDLYQTYSVQEQSATQRAALSKLYDALLLSRDAYAVAETEREKAANTALFDAVAALKESAQNAADAFGDKDEIDWDYRRIWYNDTNINEVTVDFR